MDWVANKGEKKMLIFICILAIISLGCEEAELCSCPAVEGQPAFPVWIGDGCTDNDVELIQYGVDALNCLACENSGRPIIEIIGWTDVDYNTFDTDIPTIRCYHEEPVWFYDVYDKADPRVGSAIAHKLVDLYFYRFYLPEVTRLGIIMHELVHFIGVSGHTNSNTDVMSTRTTHIIEYTDNDADLYCDFIECI